MVLFPGDEFIRAKVKHHCEWWIVSNLVWFCERVRPRVTLSKIFLFFHLVPALSATKRSPVSVWPWETSGLPALSMMWHVKQISRERPPLYPGPRGALGLMGNKTDEIPFSTDWNEWKFRSSRPSLANTCVLFSKSKKSGISTQAQLKNPFRFVFQKSPNRL